MFFPVLVIVVGLVWLLKNLGILTAGAWDVILPAVVILAGLSMLTKKHGSWCHCKWCREDKEPTKPL